MDFGVLRRAMIRGAREVNPADPKAALKAIINARFEKEFTNGAALVSSSGNGFSSPWSTLSSFTPDQIATRFRRLRSQKRR
jgi:hypothetical protein